MIDKDHASGLLAAELGADALAILIDVDAVYADWGTREQHPIDEATPESLSGMDFAASSMAPKVAAACAFVERTGGMAQIGALDAVAEILAGKAGTRVKPKAQG